MKKIIITIAVIAAMSLMTVSCKNNAKATDNCGANTECCGNHEGGEHQCNGNHEDCQHNK